MGFCKFSIVFMDNYLLFSHGKHGFPTISPKSWVCKYCLGHKMKWHCYFCLKFWGKKPPVGWVFCQNFLSFLERVFSPWVFSKMSKQKACLIFRKFSDFLLWHFPTSLLFLGQIPPSDFKNFPTNNFENFPTNHFGQIHVAHYFILVKKPGQK